MATSLKDINQAYETFRSEAFRIATEEAHQNFHLPKQFYLTSMNDTVLRTVQNWRGSLAWWSRVCQGSNNSPKNFNVALFDHHEVVGAAFGRVPKGKTHVRIDMMQRNPDSPKAKGFVTPLCVLAALNYAALIGAQRVLITNPEDAEGVHRQNQKLGTYVPRGYSPFPDGHYVVPVQ